jgi:hypothetical protein
MVWEVAGKKRLIDRHVFERFDALAFFNFQHAIHQQDGITVRQLLQNLVDIHAHFC